MKMYKKKLPEGTRIFVGIDLHKHRWHVTICTEDIDLFRGSIPGTWRSLYKKIEPYMSYDVTAVYEAGCFGFWLYDRLISKGVNAIVTPPSLIPTEYGNRVKTDKKDSRKLAYLLSKGLLKEVNVPTLEERYHRQVKVICEGFL